MDIATLLETHRRYMLEVATSSVLEDEGQSEDENHDTLMAVAIAHDRATTKTLLDLYRSGGTGNGQQLVGQASTASNTVTITPSSRKVKAGSKKARNRAIKAGETRRRNLAARQGTQTDTPLATAINGGTASEGGAA